MDKIDIPIKKGVRINPNCDIHYASSVGVGEDNVHVGIIALQIHIAVSSLRRNEHRCAVRVSARYVEAVGMRHRIVDRIVGPFPLSGGLAADWIDALQYPRIKAEGEVRVQIVQEPDLIHSVAVQIK